MVGISKGNPDAWGRNVGEVSFLSTLSAHDLGRLRLIVKQVARDRGEAVIPDDRTADRIIEAMGPETLENLKRRYATLGAKVIVSG